MKFDRPSPPFLILAGMITVLAIAGTLAVWFAGS
jgi:hypothetical protein